MNITDINGQDGPFWESYQETRERDGIIDNPAFVPFWFLEKLARDRIAAARIGLEIVGSPQAQEAWRALGTLADALRASACLDDREQIVLGLLGAQEIETAWERAERWS